MGGILEELGMLGRGLMRGSKSGNVPRLLAREAESGLAPRFAPPPATAPMAAPVAPSGIRAYHGSPHSFDRFSMDKIGTGEGAQAYGHGLYFAENEGVAKSYADTLTKNAPWDGKAAIEIDNSTLGDGRVLVTGYTKYNPPGGGGTRRESFSLKGVDDEYQSVDEALADLKAKGKIPDNATTWTDPDSGHLHVSTVPPRMYEVNIKADPERFIDWDKPLSEQPEILNRIVARYGGEEAVLARQKAYEDVSQKALDDFKNPEVQREWDELHHDPAARLGGIVQNMRKPVNPFGYDAANKTTGESLHHALATSKLGRAGVGEFLKGEGIPGIKYLDAGSRAPTFDEGIDIYQAGQGQGVYITKEKGGGYFKSRADAVAELKKRFPQSRNYVVWDDSIIEVVKKFGIAGALGAGLITQEMADQMRAQGMPDSVSRKTSPAGPSAMPNPQRFGG